MSTEQGTEPTDVQRTCEDSEYHGQTVTPDDEQTAE